MLSQSLRAFVIEDDAHNLRVISNILSEQGIHFKRNTTGVNVLRQLQKMQPRPDFILLDLDLSHADPFDITSEIRSDPNLQDVPIICLGLTEAQQFVGRARESGCDGFLTKPLPRRLFADLLRRILDGEQLWALAV